MNCVKTTFNFSSCIHYLHCYKIVSIRFCSKAKGQGSKMVIYNYNIKLMGTFILEHVREIMAVTIY